MERLGVPARSRYVEQFWLPVLGPSATLLLRRAAELLVVHPDGCARSAADLARALGLGGTGGRHAPFPRAVGRLVRYGMARRTGPDAVAFRRVVGLVPLRLALRLPPPLQREHEEWLERHHGERSLDRDGSERARLLALSVAGVAPGDVLAAHLLAIGVGAESARAAAQWVSAGVEAADAVVQSAAGAVPPAPA